MKLYLLLGQSNMAGRGDMGEVPPIRDPRCRMMRNGRFQAMSEPICSDRPPDSKYPSGVGLSASFARCAAEYHNEPIGLIPCADGGTSLADWAPGGLLYDHAVLLTGLAMRSGELAGILWHQGESDSKKYETAISYAQRLDAMMSQLQTDLGVCVPLILGELGYYLGTFEREPQRYRYYSVVNEQLHLYAAAHDNCAVVSAAGLAPRGDGLHFCSAALRELGVRYFTAYRQLTEA